MKLDDIRATQLDGTTKGIPVGTASFPLSELGSKGWNLLNGDLPMPQMVLRRSKLDHNLSVFSDYVRSVGASLAPHGKTTMAPQLFAEQIEAGAWGITAATVQQAAVMHRYGVRRVLMANQLIGKANVLGAAALLNGEAEFDFYTYVDSSAQLAELTRHLEGVTLKRPMRLLIEIGTMGGRTGLRDNAEAAALAAEVAKLDRSRLRFAGLSLFEGIIPGGEQQLGMIRAFAEKVAEVALALPADLMEGMEEFILSGGGSGHFDVIADRFSKVTLPVPVRVVLRSGCYITMDHGGYTRTQEAARLDPTRSWKSKLEPAIEAWALVQSMPEPGLALVTMGKRDVPYDSALPKPLQIYRPGVGFLPCGEAEVRSLNDQHGFVHLGEGADWQIGDILICGISHPCTAFDKWRFLPIVDDEYTVVDGVLTYF